MGRNFVVTRGSRSVLGRKKRTITKSIVIGPSAIKFITLTVIAVLAIVYLSQSTAGASRGIEVGKIQAAKDGLTLQEESLSAEQNRLKSLSSIDSGTQKQVMEPVSGVNYVGNAH